MAVRPRFLVALVLCCVSAVLAQQPPAASSSSRNAKPEQHVTKAVPAAESSEGVYRNAEFGFAYRTVVGWVDRTKQMQGGESAAGSVLLAVFERPPEASGDTVNSAVVIARESAASYPGLKAAADYVGPLTELVTSKGFKPDGDPYEFPVGTNMLVRCDFTRELGKLTMRQSTLILLQKSTIISFTFVGGSEEEVESLVERLSFVARRGSAAK